MSTAVAFGVAPLRAALLDDPIAFLSAEHSRQMALLSHLERPVRAPRAKTNRVMAGALLRRLTEELPVHIADEEPPLYPRLHRHAAAMVDRLSAGHQRDTGLATRMIRDLRAIAAGEGIRADTLRDAAVFARLHRHHPESADGTVMPLARRLLSPAEQTELAGEMAQRRRLNGE